jgi:eukaryotic-like serine/threonine-protein kinase
MPLGPGAKVGPYEVLAPLGAGGMGEVYRARDERLARDVAVKVLPAGFTSDPERLRRFEQEARATGALNHPNILAVHDTGHHDGSPYVVSELLEGQTLRERAAGGALPVRKAVEIGAQIARGLAAAHDKGIVHRDLKPENVFVTSDGQLKILDFGLAKLTQAEGGAQSQSPTEARGTEAGTVLGTVGYMSPEQVRGVAVDHRSDIFSLGAILYELLSGRRAFRKETSAETMTAILREDPPDLTETGKAIAPALERIVSHCLEKNPQERFASARDLAFDLESLSEKSGATTTRARVVAGRRRRWGTAAAWLASLAAAGATAFWIGQRAAARPHPRYEQLSFGHGSVVSARFSPDEAILLYTARWKGAPPRVYALRLDLQVEQPLGLEGRVVGVAAGEVAFLREETLLRAPLSGSGVREVANGVLNADWSSDGKRFAITRSAGAKQALEFPIGTMRHETVGFFQQVRISPDGTSVAYVENPSLGVIGGWIGIADAKGVRRLTGEGLLMSIAWTPDGRELWFTEDEGRGYRIGAVSMSGRARTLLRTPQMPILHASSRDGRVLLSLGESRRMVAGRAAGDAVERDLTVRGYSQSWDISEDGRRYVVSDAVGGEEDLSAFLGSLDAAPLVRLGAGGPNSISPDGRAVVAWKASPRESGTHLVLLPTGAGEPRDVPRGSIRSYLDARFLPDGRRLLSSASEEGKPRRLFLQELPDGVPTAVTPEGIYTEYAHSTPDGAWVAAGSDFHAAAYQLYPLGGGEPRPIPGLEKGDQPLRFSADGRRLYVRESTLDMSKVRIATLDLASGRKLPWKVLSPADPAGVVRIDYVYLTPDGSAYVYNYVRNLSDLFLVTGLN